MSKIERKAQKFVFVIRVFSGPASCGDCRSGVLLLEPTAAAAAAEQRAAGLTTGTTLASFETRVNKTVDGKPERTEDGRSLSSSQWHHELALHRRRQAPTQTGAALRQAGAWGGGVFFYYS